MRLPMILAIARAEIRSVRRLVRYWVFALLSVLFTFLAYGYYTVIHTLASRFSATVGAVGPRYLMSGVGLYFVVIFLLGLIFLAFDVRARDERERIAEVLDSRPVSNPEFLAGRANILVGVLALEVEHSTSCCDVFHDPRGNPDAVPVPIVAGQRFVDSGDDPDPAAARHGGQDC